MEKLKDSSCAIIFMCIDEKNCVYNIKKKCKHRNVRSDECNSSVAQLNRMMLHAKHIGLDLSAKGFKNE